jgi:hypothetical protein
MRFRATPSRRCRPWPVLGPEQILVGYPGEEFMVGDAGHLNAPDLGFTALRSTATYQIAAGGSGLRLSLRPPTKEREMTEMHVMTEDDLITALSHAAAGDTILFDSPEYTVGIPLFVPDEVTLQGAGVMQVEDGRSPGRVPGNNNDDQGEIWTQRQLRDSGRPELAPRARSPGP